MSPAPIRSISEMIPSWLIFTRALSLAFSFSYDEPLVCDFWKKKGGRWAYLFDWLTRETAKHAEWSRFFQRRIPHHTKMITTKWIIKDLERICIYSLKTQENESTKTNDKEITKKKHTCRSSKRSRAGSNPGSTAKPFSSWNLLAYIPRFKSKLSSGLILWK